MLNSDGYEIPDNTPVSIPTRLRLPQSRTDQIRQFIRAELSRQALDQGHETFSEADDFELDDGETWVSPYEGDFDPPGGIGGEAPDADVNKAPAGEQTSTAVPDPEGKPAVSPPRVEGAGG